MWAVWGTVLGVAALVAIEIPAARSGLGLSLRMPGSGAMRRMVLSSLPLALPPVVLMLFYNMDSVVLGYLSGPRAVGLFNAAYKVMLFLNGVVFVYVQAIYPVMTRLAARGGSRLQELIMEALPIVGAAVVPIGIGGVVMAPEIIGWIFGAAYRPSIPIFQILIWTSVAYGLEVHFSFALLAAGREGLYTRGVVLGGVGNLVLALVLVPFAGGQGAASPHCSRSSASSCSWPLRPQGPWARFV